MLITVGQFFFRQRNYLLPVVLVALLLIAAPRPFGRFGFWESMAVAGIAAIAAGQTLRVITIGLDYIKRGGKQKKVYADRLVTGGIYAHCRNPMYVGNLLIAFGWLMLIGQPVAIAVGGAIFLFVYMAIVRAEESYLADRFGDEYRAYCRRTPRWLVRIPALLSTVRRYRFDWPAVVVKEYGTLFTTAAVTTGLLAWKIQRSGEMQRYLPYLIVAAALMIVLYAAARWLKKGRALKPLGPSPRHRSDDLGLSEQRALIDDVDARILELLNRRASHVLAIFQIKAKTHAARLDRQRTEQIIDRLISMNHGPLSDDDVRALYDGLLRWFANEFQRSADDELPSPMINVLIAPGAVARVTHLAATVGSTPA